MAQIMRHDEGDASATPFLQIAADASNGGDPMRLLEVVSEKAGDLIRNDPMIYALDLVVTLLAILFALKVMRRVLWA